MVQEVVRLVLLEWVRLELQLLLMLLNLLLLLLCLLLHLHELALLVHCEQEMMCQRQASVSCSMVPSLGFPWAKRWRSRGD
jgi:hypothetical protein